MNVNVCIGCGCDKDHACKHGDSGCWWLRFEAAAHAGVCSRCEDLVPAWDAGERALQIKLVAERFHRQVMFLYDDEASARAWVMAPHPAFDGKSAADLIESGELERVHAVLDQLRDGAYT